MPNNITKPKKILLLCLLGLTLFSIFLYLVMRTGFFLLAEAAWYEALVAVFLLAAEIFILVHGAGYFWNVLHVIRHGKSEPLGEAILDIYPPVAIIVSSFHEPLEVLEDTLVCFYNLSYPNKHLYFLDDTRYDLPNQDSKSMAEYRQAVDALCKRIGVNLFRRRWHHAKAGMINDFLDFIAQRPKPGFEFYPFGGDKSIEPEKYIVVFDADQNPFPDFVETLVAQMEHNPKLAFIQTPQYYTNFESNRVARAAGLQQAVFYEYICEGKGFDNAMFCCGTNVIFRREALEQVGGLEESSVTEDFATSLKFHINGWSSAYSNRVCAFGMGPEDLGSFFKQQFRWALGTVGLFRSILLNFFGAPHKLPLRVWWEYVLSGTHYFVGWVFLIMTICPILYLFTSVPSCFVSADFYLLFFTPYMVLTMSMFLWTLKQRNYQAFEVYIGIMLNPISFPIYIRASTLALLGYRGKFAVTPKAGSHSLPFAVLWPQVGLCLLCFSAVIWGGLRLYYERQPIWAITVNTLWCFYFFIVLCGVFYFNVPEEKTTEVA